MKIPKIHKGYQNLRIQELTHKGFVGSLYAFYRAGRFFTQFLKIFITVHVNK
jgi:hypothetical protein